jgi:hypothetical protein
VSGVFKPTIGALSSTQIQVVAFRDDTHVRLASTIIKLHWLAYP